MPSAAFGGKLARTLLRRLVIERGAVVPRDVLIDALWEEARPADPAANLNVLVNRARRAVGDTDLIVTSDGGYGLAAGGDCIVDAEAFSSQVAAGIERATSGQPAAALRDLEVALRLWADPLPEDVYRDWAQPYRQRLLQEHEQAVAAAAEAALDVRDHRRAAVLAREAATRQPLSEAANLLLVRALAASGDSADALEMYARWRSRLAEELGLSPSSEAERLQMRLLRGEPLPAPARRPTVVVTRPTDDDLAFVGRDAVTAEVLDVLSSPPRGTAVVLGLAGAGKSRLLTEVAVRADVPVLRARAFSAERERPWGLARDLLREALGLDPAAPDDLPPRLADALTDILPEAVAAKASPQHGDTRRALAVEAGLRVLERVATQGILLVCDDIQWADPSSLGMLAAVRDRLDDVGLALACRVEGLDDGDRLMAFLDELEASGPVHRIHLAPLDRAAIADLVDGPEVVEVVARHTDGTPMAVAEVLRSLARDGHAHPVGAGRWRAGGRGGREAALSAAESGQRRAIGSRVAQRSSDQRELLAVLALFAREVPAALVAEAVDAPQRQVLADLQRLGSAGLTRVTERGWAVAHDLIADIVVERLAAGQRARLHGLLAEALEGRTDHDELARHRAGAGDAEGAAEAYGEAAAERLARSATQEALRLADAGLTLAEGGALRARLLRSRAEAKARRGDLAGASQDLRAALDHAVAGPERALILARMTLLATGADDLIRAEELSATALVEAGTDPSARARALSAAAIVDMNTGAAARADERSAEAQRLYESLGDAHGVADIVDNRAMQTFLAGHIMEAVSEFDRAARLFTDAGDLLRVITPRSTRGHGLVFAGDAASGLRDTELALELALELGDPEGEVYARWHRSEALTATGRTTEAVSSAERAVNLARRIGHRGWTAMALRALGIARRAAGDLAAATAAFQTSLAEARGVGLFSSWAAAQLALVHLDAGDLDEAEAHVQRALADGPPLAGYEARLAQAELRRAQGAADAAEVASQALRLARRGGHVASADRLAQLARSDQDAVPLPER